MITENSSLHLVLEIFPGSLYKDLITVMLFVKVYFCDLNGNSLVYFLLNTINCFITIYFPYAMSKLSGFVYYNEVGPGRLLCGLL